MIVETLEKNKSRLTFEVSAEKFEMGLKHSYNKNKANINMPGFRKGKAPRKLIEVQYGKEIFYEDAIDFVLQDAYVEAKEESGLDIIAQPEFKDFKVQPDKSVVFTVEVTTKPVVKLGDYSGFTYKKPDLEPTEEEIAIQIEDALEKNSREITITDRPIMNGDIAVIDFCGYIDGEPFENGSGKDYELKIGSNTFIPGFEEQLIGHETGDDVKVNTRFPDKYHAAEVAGRDVVFEVEIIDIKYREKPVLDDDFASDVSEFDTLDEYRNSIAEKIREGKKVKANQQRENELVRQLVECCEVDVPDIMIDNHTDNLVAEFSRSVTDRGVPFELYLQYSGHTEESIRASYRELAAERVKGRLVLEALAEAEAIEVNDNDIEERIRNMAIEYNIDLEKLQSSISSDERAVLAEEARIVKAINFLIENATEVQ